MPRIDFVYFDAGGGHRAAATALEAVIARQHPEWQVRLVHLRDILDSVDVFRKVLRIDLQEIYNTMLRKGWTLGSVQGLRFMHAVIALYRKPAARLIADWFRADPPDMLVSVVPNFNLSIYEGFHAVAPGKPYVTVLTDLADYPPHFWIEQQAQYFICGTDKAVEQARAAGHSAERVFRVSGMILHPRFYDPVEVDVAAERRALGLDPNKPTALVLFGGYGSSAMGTIVERLEAAQRDVQLILICGKNEALRGRLAARKTQLKIHVEGFTTRIPYFMKLSDFLIGKPGPGSISESLHMGLPVITECNAWTLPQERFNAAWLEEQQLGIVLPGFRRIDEAVGRLLQGDTLGEYRRRAAAIHNRALFEIPEILNTICRGTGDVV